MSSTSTWAVSVERTRPEDALAIRSVLGAFSSLIPSDTVDRLATENGGTVPSLSLEQANQVMLKLHEAGVHSSKRLEARIEIHGDSAVRGAIEAPVAEGAASIFGAFGHARTA